MNPMLFIVSWGESYRASASLFLRIWSLVVEEQPLMEEDR